jgi:hypothetical protein
VPEPLVLCGSLSRPHLPLLKWVLSPQILVEPAQLELYQAAHPGLNYHVLPEGGRGFSYMMNRMVETALKLGRRYFYFSDDDILGVKGRGKGTDKFRTLKPEEIVLQFSELEARAERDQIAELAISFSGSSWGNPREWVEPTGAWGLYLIDAYAIQAVGGFDEDLWLFADWEMSARLIQSGYRCARTNLLTFEHKMRGMEGGADWLYKQKARVEAAVRKLHSKYGPEVCRVEFIEQHQQYEIRFNWRKLKAQSSS